MPNGIIDTQNSRCTTRRSTDGESCIRRRRSSSSTRRRRRSAGLVTDPEDPAWALATAEDEDAYWECVSELHGQCGRAVGRDVDAADMSVAVSQQHDRARSCSRVERLVIRGDNADRHARSSPTGSLAVTRKPRPVGSALNCPP